MSRCGISSSAGVVSTNVRRGLLDVLGEVGKVAQHVRSGETDVPHIWLAECAAPLGPLDTEMRTAQRPW
jgi:hypothetical protein